MDISSITPKTRVIDILHPGNRQPIGLKVHLDSHYCQKVQAANEESRNRMRHAIQRGKDIPDIGEDNALIAAISGWVWEGDLNFQGEKPDCTKSNIRKVFSVLPWIKDQVRDEVNDVQAFFEV